RSRPFSPAQRAGSESSRRCDRPWSRGAPRSPPAGAPEPRPMKIGISLFNNQGIEDVQALVGLAEQAEALGFDSVWVHDPGVNVGHLYHPIGGRAHSAPLATPTPL